MSARPTTSSYPVFEPRPLSDLHVDIGSDSDSDDDSENDGDFNRHTSAGYTPATTAPHTPTGDTSRGDSLSVDATPLEESQSARPSLCRRFTMPGREYSSHCMAYTDTRFDPNRTTIHPSPESVRTEMCSNATCMGNQITVLFNSHHAGYSILRPVCWSQANVTSVDEERACDDVKELASNELERKMGRSSHEASNGYDILTSLPLNFHADVQKVASSVGKPVMIMRRAA